MKTERTSNTKIWQVYSGGRRIGQVSATETSLRSMFPGEWLEIDARRGTATVFGRA